MRSSLHATPVCIALALCGCYSYPYGGGPTYAPGPMYGSPVYTPGPAGGSYVVPNGGEYVPSTTSPTPLNGTSQPKPTWQPDPGTNAYPDRPVPKPSDFGTDPNDNGFQTPFKDGASSSTFVRPPVVAANPLPANPNAAPMPVTQTAGSVPDEEYGHDPDFRWINGRLQYDALDESWNILYDLSPPSADPYGGSLTLGESTLLSGLQNDIPVRIEGILDRSARDRFGKPVYRVTSLLPAGK